ncbi:4,4'-diaponeurosporenoate glycosyltransferase [bacterium HR07]|uniref:Glycosyl transferase family 2 n=2 Tax=Candidatus Bipolaricaulota TaxID=67810 RepID=H5SDJ4_9BACT|nr:glycosyl transferase family 2 [uncultured Acetothermia bacterium]BAL60260.1 glycosyl transferase family 2 [Candidatus Acetothermum autotrophicum]GBC75817.1 4,4'-diaponeurosporenoate glycosyltransferase [bacterium HR07]
MRVSAIVPAYNEAERIGAVLWALRHAPSVGEVIVVDDGSTDGTAQVAREFGVRVISLPANCGKSVALDRGVQMARYETVLFLDADLVGLRPDHIERMIQAYREEGRDMVVGVFRGGRLNTDLAQTIAPYLSGQRVLSKSLWKKLRRKVHKLEFGVEIALTKLALKENWTQGFVELDGVTHVMKEEKFGLSRGLASRFKMYGDIVRSVFTRVT